MQIAIVANYSVRCLTPFTWFIYNPENRVKIEDIRRNRVPGGLMSKPCRVDVEL